MRITESQLRKIIRGEIRKSMLREGNLEEISFGSMAKTAGKYALAAGLGAGGMYAADHPEQTRAAVKAISPTSVEEEEIANARKALRNPNLDHETRSMIEQYIESVELEVPFDLDDMGRPGANAKAAIQAAAEENLY